MKLTSTTLWASLGLAGIFIALFAWALSSPMGASPDEDFHLASIWCANGDKPGLCQDDPGTKFKNVNSVLLDSACYAFDPSKSAGCIGNPNNFDPQDLRDSFRQNQLSLYPPVYYSVAGFLASDNITGSVITIRLMNILLFVLSFVSLWLLSPAKIRRALFWTWAALVVPLGMFLISSLSPSSWALTAVPSAALSLYLYFTSSGKKALFAGGLFALETFIAAGTRGDAAIYTIISSAVVVSLTMKLTKPYLLRMLLPVAMVPVALYFYLVTTQSSVAVGGMLSASPEGARSALGVLARNLVTFPELYAGALGFWPLGWLDTPMPGIVWVLSCFVVTGLLFTAMGSWSKRVALILAGLAGVLIALPLYVLQKGMNYVGEEVQPRYLFPLMAVFLLLALVNFNPAKRLLSRLQTLTVLLFLTAGNAVALYLNTKRYVSGIDNGVGLSLDGNIEWWWQGIPSPMSVWVFGALAFGIALFAGSRLVSAQEKLLS